MRFLVSVLAVSLLALMALAGCNSMDKAGGNTNVATKGAANQTTAQPQKAAPQPNLPSGATPSDGVRRITVSELDSALKSGKALVGLRP